MQDGNQEKRNDEIDLIEVFGKFKDWAIRQFNWTLTLIGDLVRFIYRKKWYLALFILIGTLISIGLYKTEDRYYSSQCTIKNNAYDNTVLKGYLAQLNDYLEVQDSVKFAHCLNTFPEQANKIREINIRFVIDKNNDGVPDYIDYTEEDSTAFKFRMSGRLAVQVISLEDFDLNIIRQGLIHFVDQNPLFIKQNTIRLRQQNELISFYQEEIKTLDSLQNKEYFKEANKTDKGQIVFLNEQQPQMFYKNKLDIKEKIQNIQRNQELYSAPLMIIQDFTPWIQPENSLSYYVKKWVPGTFFFGILLLLFITYRKHIQKILERRD